MTTTCTHQARLDHPATADRLNDEDEGRPEEVGPQVFLELLRLQHVVRLGAAHAVVDVVPVVDGDPEAKD